MKYFRFTLNIIDGVKAENREWARQRLAHYIEQLSEQGCIGDMATLEEISEEEYYETDTGSQDPY